VRTILLEDFTSLAIIMWVCLVVTTLGDLFARTDLCTWKKVAWAVAILTIPMGTFAYMALQSRAITDRKAARLSLSDPKPASSSNLPDEIGEDCLVPMIQHAIEITGILEAEAPRRATTDPEQIGLCDGMLSGEHALARESIRSGHDDGDHQRFPAVAL